jgi:hypothetical protein
MWLRWRRLWPLVALLAASLTVVAVYVAVDRFSGESPNYTRIDEGLWLGGFVAEPPPGTSAVLNLCETDDPFQTEVHRW